MYTFSQLLARNALFGLVFFVVITLAAILMQQSTLKKQQLDHGNRLSVFVNTLDESDKQQLATTLNKLANYAELTITSGEERAKGVIQTATLNPVIDILMPPTEQLTNNKHEVIIRYRVNFSDNIRLLLNLSALLFILLAIFCTVAASMSAKRYSRFLNGIGQQIKKELQMVISNSEDPNFEQVFKLDELSDGINEIRAFIEKQQSTAVTLENQAYVDSLTKLNNRSRFVQYFENQIHNNSEKSFGVLIVTRCSELQTINQIRGYNEGDRYICKIAEIMKSVSPTFGGAEIYRLNSSDFATILPNMTLADGENFAKTIAGRFNEYQQASDLDSVAYSGLVAYDGSSPLGELLALADTGISVAQTQHINAWFSQKDSSILEAASASYGNQNWRQEIENVLENQRVSLMVQPIKPNSRNNKVYGEILARFLNSNNEMLPTASFIAMAEKLDKIVSIDRLIIESAMNEIATKNLTEGNFGINISARSIHDEHFLIWLERRLLRETSISSRLIFEISEYGLQQNIKSSKRFIDMVHRTGARITVERFGVGLTSFKFFRDLKPDFIKMDSTYTRDIDEDKNNQYFLRLMVDLAHRLSIQVLAESVETLEEKHALEKLFIDGCQGYYISKPTPL